MALVIKDRVKETSTTTGTGTLTLAGAVTGFRSFADIGNANTCPYVLLEDSETAPTAWEVGIGTYTASGTTFARTTVLRTSAGDTTAITLSSGTHTVFCGWPADYGLGSAFAQQAVIPGGRLTLTTAVPVTTADVTGATTVYYTPYIHNVIGLWDGARWVPTVFAEVSHALGTVTSGKAYDVFGYLSAGALALEKLVWTSDTARATDVTLQDGRYCKSGDKTRLYLGTFYSTSTTETEDSAAKRYLYNAYNRVNKFTLSAEGSSHTVNDVGPRQWNNGSGTLPQSFFICGLPTPSVALLYIAAMITDSGGGTSTANNLTLPYFNGAQVIATGYYTQLYLGATVSVSGIWAYMTVWAAPRIGLNQLDVYEQDASNSTLSTTFSNGRTIAEWQA